MILDKCIAAIKGRLYGGQKVTPMTFSDTDMQQALAMMHTRPDVSVAALLVLSQADNFRHHALLATYAGSLAGVLGNATLSNDVRINAATVLTTVILGADVATQTDARIRAIEGGCVHSILSMLNVPSLSPTQLCQVFILVYALSHGCPVTSDVLRSMGVSGAIHHVLCMRSMEAYVRGQAQIAMVTVEATK